MSYNKVVLTGINTSNLKVMSHKKMLELFHEYQDNGNIMAKEELVNGNLKLVLSIVSKFNSGKHNLDDLFQVGIIGLIKAIDNFDLSYNLKLSTYAVPLILGEIKRYIRDNTIIRVSRSVKDLSYEIVKFQEDYHNKHGKYPTGTIISKELNIPEYQVAYALESLRVPQSIFEPIFSDGNDIIYLEDQICDKKLDIDNQDMLISLRKALTKLKERERNVLVSRYIVGKTQMEIAESLNISQAQVSRIEKSAMDNVRNLIK